MSFSYIPTTVIGQCRLYAQDTNPDNYAFSDEEINVILGTVGSEPIRAASRMLLFLASNRAKLAVVRAAGDYREDLSKLAAELRAQAKALLDMVGMEPAEATAEMMLTDMAYREYMRNKALQQLI